jgi:hypothetical protein
MHRTRHRNADRNASRGWPHLVWLAILALLLATTVPLLAGCDGTEDTGVDAGSETDADGTVEDDADTDGEADEGTDDTTAEDGTSGDSDGAEPDTGVVESPIALYFAYAGGNALAVDREVETTDTLPEAAMRELLAGPTEAELETWPALGTEIPEGTRLLGLEIEDGVALVDLSEEFEQGGGTASITARVAQVVYTLTEFEEIDAVEFYLDGERVEVFSGEGLMLDEPRTREDYEQLVPIDA